MKHMQKCLMMILCLALVLTACFSASAETPEQSALPLTDEKVTFTVAICANTQVSEFDAEVNRFSQWLEDKTNIHLDFTVFPVEQQAAAINTYLAAGQYADMMMFQSTGEFSSATMYAYAKSGAFIPMNDLIDQYGYNVQDLFERVPLMRAALTQADGNIYTLPALNEVQHQFCIDKAFVYKPFLDAVGITELPSTLDGFRDMLIAFRDLDPNGNGVQDEIPCATYYTNDYIQYGAGIEAYLMDAFIVTSKATELLYTAIQDGEIIAGFTTDEWKDGLKWIRGLCEEGLIAPESFTQDSTQLLAMGENPGDPILGVALCGQPPRFITLYGESGRWIEYECLPALIGPSGKQEAMYNPYFGYRPNGAVITSSCENPELAFKLLDFMYSPEAAMTKYSGFYGEQWTDQDIPEDGVAVNGGEPLWRSIAAFGTNENFTWRASGPNGMTQFMRTSELASEDLPLEPWLYNETEEKYLKYKQSDDTVMPLLHYEVDEIEEILDLSTTINNYVKRMIVSFVTGKTDIDEEWDNYVQTIDSMGVNRCLEIMNNAYDRYKAMQ